MHKPARRQYSINDVRHPAYKQPPQSKQQPKQQRKQQPKQQPTQTKKQLREKQKTRTREAKAAEKVRASQAKLRHKKRHQQPPEALFESYANIRRFHGTLMTKALVFDTLVSAGYAVEQGVHKQGTKQSHGRWEVRGGSFEVHPGYHENRAPPAPLVDTIVQGLKGWKAATLDGVARSLQTAVLSAAAPPPVAAAPAT